MPQKHPPLASHTTPNPRAATTVLAALALFACLMPLTATAAPAKDVTIHGGWMTPTEYRVLPDGQRGAYVTGVVEGWFHAPAFGAPERNTDRVVQCLGALKPGQLMQAVDLYVTANPAERDKTMNFLVYSALSDFCANRKP